MNCFPSRAPCFPESEMHPLGSQLFGVWGIAALYRRVNSFNKQDLHALGYKAPDQVLGIPRCQDLLSALGEFVTQFQPQGQLMKLDVS